MTNRIMPLSVGDTLGPYEILSQIGAGGMGVVYKARDTRLDRMVALKVSTEQYSERFGREARAVAALNHPNICQIYDVGPNYIVMELVEGESPRGPMPLETALNYARQIADALEAAHEKNIVHRDLKPGNIKITPEGKVKVLDFGLAKLPPVEPGSTTENSPTLTMGATQAGVVLGTAAYMSPEQARGKPVDKRADIWAFGVVLFELLTGQRPFQGEDLTETLASVVKEQPRIDQAPAQVRRLLKKCLEKDPKKRLRDIGDVWELLDQTPAPYTTAPSPSRLGWGIAAVLAVIAAALAFIHFREQPPVAELTRFQVPLPPNEAFPVAGLVPQAISPDGRKLAFMTAGARGKLHFWIRSFDSLGARALPGVDPRPSPQSFFWSPDSRFLAFLSSDLKLKKVAVAGGPPQTLCDAPGAL